MGMKSWIAQKALNFAKPYIKAELSVDKLADYAVEGVDWAASSATKNVSDERLAQIARGCTLGASVFGNLAAALDPASDGGRKITPAERAPLRTDMRTAVLCIVTPEKLDAMVDSACERAPRRLS